MTWLSYLSGSSSTPRWVVGLLLFLTFCRPAPQTQQRLNQPKDVEVILHYLNTDKACPTEQVEIGLKDKSPHSSLSWSEEGTQTVTIPGVMLREQIRFSFDCVDEAAAKKGNLQFKWHAMSYPVPSDPGVPLEVFYKRSPESVEYSLSPFYQ